MDFEGFAASIADSTLRMVRSARMNTRITLDDSQDINDHSQYRYI